MIFGWQGFTLEHPQDWSPVSLSGSEDDGYARIASSGRAALQVRWKRGPAGDLAKNLDSYLGRLERDARRAGAAFHSAREPDVEGISYRWTGEAQARGRLFHSPGCGRVIFIEALGGRGDSLKPAYGSLLKSFTSDGAPTILWSVLGLRVRLPRELKLERHQFQAGRTALTFSARGCRLECTRWGFGAQILAKYDLEEWAIAGLRMAGAQFVEGRGDQGLRLRKASGLNPAEALVVFQEEHNQVVTLKSCARAERWRPEWDWLV